MLRTRICLIVGLVALLSALWCSNLLAEEAQTTDSASKYILRPTKDAASPTGFHIPGDLEAAHVELQKMLTPEFIDEFAELEERAASAKLHHNLGRWIRNNWGLWRGSKLAQSLHELGFYDPDEMSGIIIASFHRRLNGKPLGVEEWFRAHNVHRAQRDQQKSND